MRKLTQDEFVRRCAAIHNGKFSYAPTVYVNRRSFVKIVCPLHGEFEQLADSHLVGRGCDKCSGTFDGDTATWIAKAENIHSGTYNYDKAVYINAKIKLTITCKAHGDFTQTPDNHVNRSQGCPMCAEHGFRDNKPGTLYVLADGLRTKVGVTNHTVNRRVRHINTDSGLKFKSIFEIRFESGSVTRSIETSLLKYLKSTYEGDNLIYNGYTEVFLNVDRNLLISKLIKVCGEVFAAQTNI